MTPAEPAALQAAGAPSFEQEATRMLGAAVFSADQTRAWGEHPDERVRALLVHLGQRHLDVGLRNRMVDRALDEAESAGEVWTPLLDTLSAKTGWGRIQPPILHRAGEAPSPPRMKPEGRLEELLPWIEAAEDPAAYEPLFGFEADEVFTLLASRAPHLTDGQIAAMTGHSRLRRAMVDNEALLSSSGHAVVRTLLEAMQEARYNASDLRQDLKKALERMDTAVETRTLELLMRVYRTDEERSDDALILLKASPATPDRMLRELLSGASYRQAVEDLLTHPNVSDETWAEYFSTQAGHSMASIMAGQPGLPGSRYEVLYKLQGEHEAVLSRLARNEDAPVSLLRHIAEHHGAFRVREWLAANATARRDRDTVALLLQTTSTTLLIELGQDEALDEDQFREILTRIAADNPAAAAKLLKYRMERAPCSIPNEALLPLLSSASDEIRRVGFAALQDEPPSPKKREVRDR